MVPPVWPRPDACAYVRHVILPIVVTERVRQVAAALDAQVIEPLAGGHFGAFRVRAAGGTDAVLKVLPDWPELAVNKVQGAAELVGRLTDRGYPAPRFLDVGVIGTDVYTVQEYVAGAVPSGLTPTTARELVGLWRAHDGAAQRVTDSHWGETVLARTIRRGDELRSATDDPRVLNVLDQAVAVASAADASVFRVGDVVHGDFSPGNLLVRDGAVAAVIDWEGAREGDSRADLLRLYAAAATWDTPESPVVSLLRKELDDTTPAEVWLPIGADIAVLHLAYGLFARPAEMDWVLREATHLLPNRW